MDRNCKITYKEDFFNFDSVIDEKTAIPARAPRPTAPPPPSPSEPAFSYVEQRIREEPPVISDRPVLEEPIPQSLRNYLPVGGFTEDTLSKLRTQPIAGYSAPTKVNPGNNRGGTYSTYKKEGSPYQTTNSRPAANSGFGSAYSIKPCLQCGHPLDRCACAMAQNSRK